MTHTAGPWIVGVDPEVSSNSKLSVHTTDEYYVALVDEGENQIANANLIAAAPDLLAALESVTQTLVWQMFGECRGFSETLDAPSVAVDKAAAAIAKAKGLTK